jgi:hypothetical protein
MAIVQNTTNFKVYKGTRKPALLEYGSTHVKGWNVLSDTGLALTFQKTYNDTADIIVTGNTVQQSDWRNKTG